MRPLALALILFVAPPALASGLPSVGLPNLDFPPKHGAETTRNCILPDGRTAACAPHTVAPKAQGR